MRITLSVTIPFAALALLAGLTRGDEPLEEFPRQRAAQKAILDLGEHLDAPDVAWRAAAIVRDHESENISSIFERSSHGGLGVGPLAVSPYQDSIQSLIVRWRISPPTPEQIDKYKPEMLRVAKAVRAMSELAPHRAPKDRPQVAKEWAEVSHEFQEMARGFHGAIEKGEPKAIRDAARKLNNTCCHCHGLRD